MLLRHYPQPHCVSFIPVPHTAHPHLPLGHAVCAPAQQALLDDSHNLHGGIFLLHCVVGLTVLKHNITCASERSMAFLSENFPEAALSVSEHHHPESNVKS